MTGLLPSRTHSYDNAAGFSSEIPTFAHHLRARGYRTVLADGYIVEYGATAGMLANPQQEYTRHLISDTPSLETATGDVPVTALPADRKPTV